MSKRQNKSHASSARASGFGAGLSSSSILSYASEPPDLASIPDAGIVVAFKSLAKKDGTTKTKGLDELHKYVQQAGRTTSVIDDAVLQAWVSSWPDDIVCSSY
jgi:E3 ubiquitin-protein ligase listerin